jgi:YD repeat-containing protein
MYSREFRVLGLSSNFESRKANGATLPFVEPQSGGTYDDFVVARLDPDNRVGTGGEDMLSRNFQWSLPLVGLPGRAGLNLGLTLSYNSLVWTRSANYITFDADSGYPTPGFRLGFPVVYGQHYNSQTGTHGYLMLMPSGNRVELRRIGSTNNYESADSSYLHLVDNGNGTLLVRSTDGTQLTYVSTSNGFRCTQAKDRNGNFVSITNSSAGRLLTITDTLGRVFTCNYDSNNNLTSISQTRGSTQYTWVTFGYTNLTLQTNFTGLTILGTQNGTTLPVLSQIGLPDGTYYKFSYNTWGQIYKLRYYAADSNPRYDSHPLNYIQYNLPLDSTTAQTDCPRFTQRKDWAENWNNGTEVATNYSVPTAASWTMPDTSQHTGTFCQMQTPDGTYYNVYTHSSGWDEGLPVLVNTWANNDQQQLVLQRTETTTRTQDNTGVGYVLNPRVIESNVYDPSGNRKRTSITYSTSYGLPVEVKEYAENASSVLRTSQTDYNLASDYTNRRIIGLPSQKRVIDNGDNDKVLSRVDYLYDDGGEFLVQQGTPIQHDATNYGSSLVTGRGNLSRIRRWDVVNTSQSVELKTGYNTTGSPIFTRSPLQTSDTQSNFIYSDSFSDGQNRNTYAYPTEATIKDTAGSSGFVSISNKSQYNFETGAVTRFEGPPPDGHSQGAVVMTSYDSIGRPNQVTNSFNSASTTYYYPTSSNVVQKFTTIQAGMPATVSAKLFDGVGRLRAVAAEHPGSTGGYVGQKFVLDVMGRQTQQTNPTEIYGSWYPAGDDVGGWVWSTQTYDWKGRPRITTNQDGKIREVSYAASVVYDGHGRVATRHVPIQSNGTSTGYTYNSDDSLHTLKDARDVTATFTYNNRNLVTSISYAVPTPAPSPAVAATAPITFRYDKVGNRTEMIDATGNTNYQFDQLSRLISETRHFNDITAQDFTLSYAYNISGGLTSIIDPFGAVTNYSHDSSGRLSSVSGTGLGVSDYISQIEYRAWGSPKRILYGNSFDLKLTYNARLAVSHFEGLKGSTVKIGADYQYEMDGSLHFSDDLSDPKLDRSYNYDQMGRIKEAKSGAEARNEPSTDDRPYKQSYNYDSWGNTTERAGRHWTQDVSFGGAYVNNRNTSYQYDADGRYTGHDHTEGVTENGYNAAGQRTVEAETTFTEEGSIAIVTNRKFDGDGQMITENPMSYCNTCPPHSSNAIYYVRSSVLGGQPVAVVNQQAQTTWRYVYANGELIASSGNGYVGYSGFEWRHNAPSGSGTWKSYATFGTDGIVERTELDPVGADVGTENPYTGGGGSGGNPNSGDLTSRLADAADMSRCSWNGILTPCSAIIRRGNAGPTRGGGSSSVFVRFVRGGEKRLVPGILTLLASGSWVYVPEGANLDGDFAFYQFGDGAIGNGRVPRATASVSFADIRLLVDLQNSTGGKPLSGNQLKDYVKTKDQARNDLGKGKTTCATLLARIKTTVDELISALDNQVAFSGPDSKDISAFDAGILPKPAPNEHERPYRISVQEAEGSVSDFFARYPSKKANTAIFGKNPNHVYFRSEEWSSKRSVVVHEALHSLSGLGDQELAETLGLGAGLASGTASEAISQALKDYGCIR